MNLFQRCGSHPQPSCHVKSMKSSIIPIKMQVKVGQLLLPMATPNSCKNISMIHCLFKGKQSLFQRYMFLHSINVKCDRNISQGLGTTGIFFFNNLKEMSFILNMKWQLRFITLSTNERGLFFQMINCDKTFKLRGKDVRSLVFYHSEFSLRFKNYNTNQSYGQKSCEPYLKKSFPSLDLNKADIFFQMKLYQADFS